MAQDKEMSSHSEYNRACIVVENLAKFPNEQAIDMSMLQALYVYVCKGPCLIYSVQALNLLLSQLYGLVYARAYKVNNPLLSIIVFLEDVSAPLKVVASEVSQVYGCDISDRVKLMIAEVASIDNVPDVDISDSSTLTMADVSPDHHITIQNLAQYKLVALGGTFDHLHVGHRILLSMAALSAQEKVLCGVIDKSLLHNKKWSEQIESYEQRLSHINKFLSHFKPSIEVDVFPLFDSYGPTSTDPAIDALVVSQETMNGALEINSERACRSLNPLTIITVKMISSDGNETTDVKLKISSTNIRQWIATKASTTALARYNASLL